MDNQKPVAIFFLEVLLWLPFTFFVWYWAAQVLTAPLTWLVRLVMLSLFPDWFTGVAQHGYLLDITSSLSPSMNAQAQAGVLIFTVNPLIYSYSLPFFVALSFASPAALSTRLSRIFWVWLLVLLPVQVFSVCVSVFKSLLFNTPAVMQLNPPAWSFELVALSFQFVTLILPTTLPIILWIGLYRSYLEELAPQLRWHQ